MRKAGKHGYTITFQRHREMATIGQTGGGFDRYTVSPLDELNMVCMGKE